MTGCSRPMGRDLWAFRKRRRRARVRPVVLYAAMKARMTWVEGGFKFCMVLLMKRSWLTRELVGGTSSEAWAVGGSGRLLFTDSLARRDFPYFLSVFRLFLSPIRSR